MRASGREFSAYIWIEAVDGVDRAGRGAVEAKQPVVGTQTKNGLGFGERRCDCASDKNCKQTKRFHAHDEENVCQIGDIVRIEESRPLSKLKRWRLVEIVKPSSGIVPVEVVLAEADPDLSAGPSDETVEPGEVDQSGETSEAEE